MVTGGASGIGLATVRRALETAAFGHVSVIDQGEGRLSELEHYGDRVRLLRADVGDQASIDATVAEIEGRGPRITALVNSAGVVSFAPINDVVQEEGDRLMAVNVTGTHNVCNSVGAGSRHPSIRVRSSSTSARESVGASTLTESLPVKLSYIFT